jgi:hypothetical protein
MSLEILKLGCSNLVYIYTSIHMNVPYPKISDVCILWTLAYFQDLSISRSIINFWFFQMQLSFVTRFLCRIVGLRKCRILLFVDHKKRPCRIVEFRHQDPFHLLFSDLLRRAAKTCGLPFKEKQDSRVLKMVESWTEMVEATRVNNVQNPDSRTYKKLLKWLKLRIEKEKPNPL